MSEPNLEQRVAKLERGLAEMRGATDPSRSPWWRTLPSVTPEVEAAMLEAERLGREYRESLRPVGVPAASLPEAKPPNTKRRKAVAVTSKSARDKPVKHVHPRHGSRLARESA